MGAFLGFREFAIYITSEISPAKIACHLVREPLLHVCDRNQDSTAGVEVRQRVLQPVNVIVQRRERDSHIFRSLSSCKYAMRCSIINVVTSSKLIYLFSLLLARVPCIISGLPAMLHLGALRSVANQLTSGGLIDIIVPTSSIPTVHML